MAYNQNPGRGNQSKTGNGIPSALLQKPDYAREDAQENAAVNGGNTMDAVKGVSYTASRMLTNFPAQGRHLKKNEQTNKDASGKTTSTSWETKVDAKNAVEQLQVARDSSGYLGNERDPKKRQRLGEEFNLYWSPNNKYNKREQTRSGKGYTGPNGTSGTDRDKYEVLDKLRLEGIMHGGYGSKEDVPEKEFGLKPTPTPLNPKAGADKLKKMGYDAKGNKIKAAPKQMRPSSPAKQTQLAGKEPKRSGPQKSDKLIKEERIAASKASFEKLQKSQESKGDKKGSGRTEPVGKQMKPKTSAAKMKKC